MNKFILICIFIFHSSIASANWSETPDFSKLRIKYGTMGNFYSLCESNRPIKDIVGELKSENWEQALKVGDSRLKQCPVDIKIHFYMAIASKELGLSQRYDNHIKWSRGLFNSIISSGDGLSPETAFITISIAEEYDVLFMKRLKKKNQALIRKPKKLDVITALDKSGKEYTIYFDPTAHFERLKKMREKI